MPDTFRKSYLQNSGKDKLSSRNYGKVTVAHKKYWKVYKMTPKLIANPLSILMRKLQEQINLYSSTLIITFF